MRDDLRDRFAALADDRDDSDWADVRRRARRRTRRTEGLVAVVAALLVVLAVVPPIGLGGRIVGLFAGHAKRVPLSSLASRDRDFLVTQFCRRATLVTQEGRVPRTSCRDGAPRVTEIANDGRHAYWKIVYRGGRVCVASGSARIHRDRVFGERQLGSMTCTEGANAAFIVPSPRRPITTDPVVGARRLRPTGKTHLVRISGLAGAGVASVGLLDSKGYSVKTDVAGRTYSLANLPARNWKTVVAYDASGKEVYREPLFGAPPAAAGRQAPPERPRAVRRAALLQHTTVPGASIDVYESGRTVVELDPAGDPYAFLRAHLTGDGSVSVECGQVAFGAGRWATLGSGLSRPLQQTLDVTIPSLGSGVTPPFDACSVRGHYGRVWDEHVGYHNALEVPFNAEAKRFFSEQAAARRVAYFVRSPKMSEIRRALKHGEPAPSSEAIATRFTSRVVALPTRDAAPPEGAVGVWSDGDETIVASQLADDGRRMYVTLERGRLGPHNLHGLAFVF